MKPATDISDPRVVKALNHPLRVEILRAIEVERASPVELSRRLEAPLGVVSYHVRVLADLGLIKLVKRTPRRGAVEHHYEAKAPVLLDDNVWKALPKAARRARNAPLLAQAGEAVDKAVTSGAFDADTAHLSLSTSALDEKGRADLATELGKVAERIERIGEASAKRAATANADGAAAPETTIVLMAFDSSAPAPAAKKPNRARAKAKA
jgi:DNA-binding transcriptional ArsR family regulator